MLNDDDLGGDGLIGRRRARSCEAPHGHDQAEREEREEDDEGIHRHAFSQSAVRATADLRPRWSHREGRDVTYGGGKIRT